MKTKGAENMESKECGAKELPAGKWKSIKRNELQIHGANSGDNGR
jgi:hypothetical protein